MKPLNLEEFAEELRRKGDYRETDFAGEILELIDLEADIAESYFDLCADLEHTAPYNLKDKPAKQCAWLIDRSNLLEEIEKQLTDAGREPEGTDDVNDVVRELLETLAEAEAILEAAGVAGEGDFLDQLRKLAERPASLEYDL